MTLEFFAACLTCEEGGDGGNYHLADLRFMPDGTISCEGCHHTVASEEEGIPAWKDLASLPMFSSDVRLMEVDGQGIQRIAFERQRQVDTEGFDAAHDSSRLPSQLTQAAAAYLTTNPDLWPFDAAWFKPTSFTRNAEKAGALVAAALDLVAIGK